MPILAPAAAGFLLWPVAGSGCAALHRGVPFLFAGVPGYARTVARRQCAAGARDTARP